MIYYNTSWIDRKYISLISPRLDKFVWKSGSLANCRCPICSDSKKSKKKARGYFYEKDGQYLFFCHNCSTSTNIPGLLKRIDNRLYEAYQFDRLSSQSIDHDPVHKTNTILKYSDDANVSQLKKLKKISQLEYYHPAKRYIDARKIPTPFHSVMRWCPNFMTWTNQMIPGKFSDEALKYDNGRIVIPLFNMKNQFNGYTGREIVDDADVKYIAISFDKEQPLLFGLNTFDNEKEGFAFEGPIDAMFVPNSIAFLGSNINALTLFGGFDKFIVVYDNEPYSRDTYKKILYAIEQGYRVVIWPNWIKEKDINKMVLSGVIIDDIIKIMNENTFRGFEAKMKLEFWSKQ